MNSHKIYYGWVVVGISILANAAILGSTTGIFGLFVVPVSAEYGLSRAGMNSVYVIISIGSAILAPLVGPVLDRVPVRPVIAAAALLLASGFAILGLSHSVWLNMVALCIMIPLGQDCGALLTMGVLVARWFKWQLGRAMALSALGMSLGAVIMPPVAALLMESVGWRTTLLAIGAGLFLLLLVLAALIREHPMAQDIEPGAPMSGIGRVDCTAEPSVARLKVLELLSRCEFWTIGLAVSLASGVATTNVASLAPFTMNSGMTMMQATSLMSITAAAAMGCKLALAWIADRVRTVSLLYLVFTLGVPLNWALMQAQGYPAMVGCAMALGMTTGIIPPLLQTLLVERFGAASYGSARGLVSPILAACAAVGLLFAGRMFDRTGHYEPAFAAFMVVQVIALIILFAGERRRAPTVANA